MMHEDACHANSGLEEYVRLVARKGSNRLTPAGIVHSLNWRAWSVDILASRVLTPYESLIDRSDEYRYITFECFFYIPKPFQHN